MLCRWCRRCQTATPFLIGTKYDYFSSLPADDKLDITTQARRFAKAMKAPLIFCSSSHSINIHKLFKVVLAKVFDLRCSVEQIVAVGDPIIEYDIDAETGLPRQQQSTGEEGEGQRGPGSSGEGEVGCADPGREGARIVASRTRWQQCSLCRALHAQ